MIEINNLTALGIDNRFLKDAAKKVLRGEKKEDYYLSIALVSPGKIKELNRKYLKRNWVTDVLSFAYPTGPKDFPDVKKKPWIQNLGSGEVIICPQRAKKNAKMLKLTFKEELSTCLIHGILHLLGHDHLKEEEKRKMDKKQNHYFSLIN